MMPSVLAVIIGGSLGCLLRWVLGMQLNAMFPSLPPGTLAANIIGGYIIGVAIAFFADNPSISPVWRLFIITGFCGGLTTFSTFSAETVSMIQAGRLGAAFAEIAVHVIGSLSMTGLGIWTYQLIHRH